MNGERWNRSYLDRTTRAYGTQHIADREQLRDGSSDLIVDHRSHARRRARFRWLTVALGAVALLAIVAAGAEERSKSKEVEEQSGLETSTEALAERYRELESSRGSLAEKYGLLEQLNQQLEQDNSVLQHVKEGLEKENEGLEEKSAWSDLPRRIGWKTPSELVHQPAAAQVEKCALYVKNLEEEVRRLDAGAGRASAGMPNLLELVAALGKDGVVSLESLQSWLAPSPPDNGAPRFSKEALGDRTSATLAQALSDPTARLASLCSFTTSRSAFFVEDRVPLLITFSSDRRILFRIDGTAPVGEGLPPVGGSKPAHESRLAASVGPLLADAAGALFVACLDSGAPAPRVCLFDARSPGGPVELTGCSEPILSLAISQARADGTRVVAGLDKSGTCHQWPVGADGVSSSAGSRVATRIQDDTARLVAGRDHMAVLSTERVAIFGASTAASFSGDFQEEPSVAAIACSTRATADWSPNGSMLVIATGTGLRVMKRSNDGRFLELERGRFAKEMHAQDQRIQGAWFTSDSTVLLSRGEQFEHWSLEAGREFDRGARIAEFACAPDATVFDVHVTHTVDAAFIVVVSKIDDGEREKLVVARCRLGLGAGDRPEFLSMARFDKPDHGSLQDTFLSADGDTLLVACVTGGYRIGFAHEAIPEDPVAELSAWALNYQNVRTLDLH